jgi:hypothetical protein
VKIRFIQREAIDTEKWDQVITESPAETIYPYSWYLDIVTSKWSALAADDYRFIMPVVWKKKAGIKYVYQPFHTQQLGVFSREYVDPQIIKEMLAVIYKKFRFAGINFNARNLVGEEDPFVVDDKSNYILELNRDYDQHYKSFSSNAKRNLRQSAEFKEELERDVPAEELVMLKKANDVIQRSEEDYARLQKLLETLISRGDGSVYAIRKGREVIAAAFFAHSRTRAIYLVSASGKTGKDHRSMFRIVDAFIREYAGSGKILDFEGSNIPSVARFFGGFGAQPEIYQGVSFSRLPASLNKLR